MKKFISVFMTLATFVFFASLNTFAATYFQYDNFVFESYSDNTCCIVEYVGTDKDMVVPEIILGDTVTSFAFGAFIDNNLIETASLPKTLTSIGDAAFSRAYNLVSVNIPENCVTIGKSVFQNCTSLKNIVFESDLTTITSQMFYGCSSLEEITIPSSVETIEKFAFRNCSSLKSVIIPKATTSIDATTFGNCSNLTIYGYSNSYAETYAKEHEIPFVTIEDIDKSELESTLSSAEAILADDNSLYTSESLEVLRSAVSAGYDVYNNDYASQSDVDKAVNDINLAMQKLVTVISDYIYGDVNLNDSVDIDDATDIQRYLAGYMDFSAIQDIVADVNCDGHVSIDDVTIMQLYLADYEVEFVGQKIPTDKFSDKTLS